MTIGFASLPAQVDCLILGGGITGAGIARDAAMRGLRVLLIDSDDFASGTSHLTSKLIHGGLRYLEQGRFRLVMDAIVERDRLLNRIAPNLVTPLRFMIPFERHQVPKWLLTVAGVQFYGLIEWFRGGRRSSYMLAREIQRRYPLLRESPFAASFWDAQTNDARLVLATLRTAQTLGATLCNYTTVESAEHGQGGWRIRLNSMDPQRSWMVHARCVVNATGPWAPETGELFGTSPSELMWVKGSHIVVRKPRRYGNDAVIIRSVLNGRSLWVVPWQNRLLIGSTESLYAGDLRHVHPHPEEIDDLFESFRRSFPGAGIGRADIVSAFAGVRPIVTQDIESENRMSREHRVDVDTKRGLITTVGGKLTTFRRMAEQTVDEVHSVLGRPRIGNQIRFRLRRDPLWPGLSRAQVKSIASECARRTCPARVPGSVLDHLARHYGEDALGIADELARQPGRAEPVCEELPYTLAELKYLCRTEAVCRLVDVIKRRTPLYFLGDTGFWERLPTLANELAPVLGWDSSRVDNELHLAETLRWADRAAFDPPQPMSIRLADVGVSASAHPPATHEVTKTDAAHSSRASRSAR